MRWFSLPSSGRVGRGERLVLLLVLLVGEVGLHFLHISSCISRLPPLPPSCPGQRNDVLAVADMQLTDSMSYGMDSSPLAALPGFGLWMRMVEHACDVYIRTAFSAVAWLDPSGGPDGLLNLGDVLDNGRHYGGDQWIHGIRRVRWIMSPLAGTPLLTVPGNHDVGIGGKMDVTRFSHTHGAVNSRLSLGPITYVGINSLAAHPDAPSVERNRFNSFLGMDVIAKAKGPVVLISHQPLFRPPQTPCGPSRDPSATHTTIPFLKGDGYVTLVDPATSDQILSTIDALVLVLSGDDHHVCDVVHHPSGIREVTLPTISWLQGSTAPGFAYLSPIRDHQTCAAVDVAVTLCSLPNRYTVLSAYALLSLCAILYVLWGVAPVISREASHKKTDTSLPITHSPKQQPSQPLLTFRSLPMYVFSRFTTANWYAAGLLAFHLVSHLVIFHLALTVVYYVWDTIMSA